MNIIPANQIKCEHSREEIVECFCENLIYRIQECAAKGKHNTCFDARVYYEHETGMLYSTYQDRWKEHVGCYDVYKYYFGDYANEVKEKFKQAGYIIKPTGYIGEVWQLTEDICW